MIEAIQNTIITALQTITGIGTVDAWQGEVDDLSEILQIPQTVPALYVIYHGGAYEDKKVIGANRADEQMRFLIILVNENQRGRKTGAASSYTVIEAVRAKLMGLKITPYPGFLWPSRDDLLHALGGLQVYGLLYRVKTSVTV